MSEIVGNNARKVPFHFKLLGAFPFDWLSILYRFDSTKAVIIEKANLAYIPIPKVANSSIKFAISGVDATADLRIHRRKFNSISIDKLDTDKYKVFAFVRSPLHRLVSLYERNILEEDPRIIFPLYGDKFRKGMPFEAFIQTIASIPDSKADKHFRSQHCFLNASDKLKIDFLGRFETIQQDWLKLNEQYHIGRLIKTNASSIKTPINYFDKTSYNLAIKRYEKDIELYNYEQETLKFKPN